MERVGRDRLSIGPVEPQEVFTRFLSCPFIIRVPLFLLFGSNKGSLNQKGQKGTTKEPRLGVMFEGGGFRGLEPRGLGLRILRVLFGGFVFRAWDLRLF